MEEVKLRTGNGKLEVKGSPETIQEQSQAFYQHQRDLEEINTKAKMEFMGRMTEKLTVHIRPGSDEAIETKRSVGKLEASWDEIQKAIRKGVKFNVGDYKTETLSNGERATFVVTDVTDEYVRFESRDCIGSSAYQNEDGTNIGGFPESDLKKYLDETIWQLLPGELQTVVSETRRKWLDKDGNKSEYSCKLFLPVAPEVFDEDDCYGDAGLYEQLEYYKDRRNRMKGSAEDKDTGPWWLASVRSGYSQYACNVTSYGVAYYAPVDYPGFGVPVCFHIKK